jgi:hypothetical protein
MTQNATIEDPLLIMIAAFMIILILLAIGSILLSEHHKIGATVPCDNYIQVTQKYTSLDTKNVVHYNLILSDRTKSEISGWPDQALDETYWSKIPMNTTGYLVKAHPSAYEYYTISFVPENVTIDTEKGENFCKVTP